MKSACVSDIFIPQFNEKGYRWVFCTKTKHFCILFEDRRKLVWMTLVGIEFGTFQCAIFHRPLQGLLPIDLMRSVGKITVISSEMRNFFGIVSGLFVGLFREELKILWRWWGMSGIISAIFPRNLKKIKQSQSLGRSVINYLNLQFN